MFDRNVKRRVSEIILSVEIRAVLDEGTNRTPLRVGALNRSVKGSRTVRLSEIDIRTAVDQPLQNVEPDAVSNGTQRSAAFGIRRIRICPAAQEQVGHLDGIGVFCRDKQRRVTRSTADQICSAVKEKLGHLEVLSLDGRMQGRPEPLVLAHHVDVAAGVEKSMHIVEPLPLQSGMRVRWHRGACASNQAPSAGSRL